MAQAEEVALMGEAGGRQQEAGAADLSETFTASCSCRLLLRSAKVVLQTHNVVFTQVGAALHFNEDQ
jgi:hypothetical protein